MVGTLPSLGVIPGCRKSSQRVKRGFSPFSKPTQAEMVGSRGVRESGTTGLTESPGDRRLPLSVLPDRECEHRSHYFQNSKCGSLRNRLFFPFILS